MIFGHHPETFYNQLDCRLEIAERIQYFEKIVCEAGRLRGNRSGALPIDDDVARAVLVDVGTGRGGGGEKKNWISVVECLKLSLHRRR